MLLGSAELVETFLAAGVPQTPIEKEGKVVQTPTQTLKTLSQTFKRSLKHSLKLSLKHSLTQVFLDNKCGAVWMKPNKKGEESSLGEISTFGIGSAVPVRRRWLPLHMALVSLLLAQEKEKAKATAKESQVSRVQCISN